jgi:lipid-A-disaccharide synthase
MDRPACVLFTAFEPSGDEHAAVVIRALRRMCPEVPIHALGGEKMAAAGATLIERTTDRAAMLGSALSKIGEQISLRRRMRRWLDEHPVRVHVPTDSPAANWAYCQMVRRRWGSEGARTVHLVAPQLWAWGAWRAAKLRRLTDRVLCVLPFEPAWFAERGIEAQFIGHPLFDRPLDEPALKREAADLPQARPRVALLPGSRPGEIRANLRPMIRIFGQLVCSGRFPQAHAVIAGASADAARLIVDHGDTPQIRSLVTVTEGRTDAVLHWADVVLTVSGTASLHITRHLTPMTILYRVSRPAWYLVGRWLIDARTLTLPNLIVAGPGASADQHVVREFIPFFGDVQSVAEELTALLADQQRRRSQIEWLGKITDPFRAHNAGEEGAAAICEIGALV